MLITLEKSLYHIFFFLVDPSVMSLLLSIFETHILDIIKSSQGKGQEEILQLYQ